MANNGTLTPAQGRAIAALMAERDALSAAKAACVGKRTLYRWMTDPAFRAALDAAQSDALAQTTRRIVGTLGQALDVLRDIMNDPKATPAARVAAARATLDAGLRFVEITELARRVQELEGRLQAEGII